MADAEKLTVTVDGQAGETPALEAPVEVGLVGQPTPAETRPPTADEMAAIQAHAGPLSAPVEKLEIPAAAVDPSVIDVESRPTS